MILKEILKEIDYCCLQGSLDRNVDEIIYDSRIKTNEGMFIAIKGFNQDGHHYIHSAIENGAKTLVVEEAVEVDTSITVIQVKDTRHVMPLLACRFYHHPSHTLNVVGVTGTNGKTSITFLLGQILEAARHKIGIIGTIENRIGDRLLKAQHTTPESIDLQNLFEQMNEANVSHCLMEVSSHALALERVGGTQFEIGIFTNLTQDHLDFHETMEAYAEAKAKLFTLCKLGIINGDSPYAEVMKAAATCECLTYGINQLADYQASHIHITSKETTYTLTTKEGQYTVCVPIPGGFTVYNTLAVIAAARALGLSMAFILETLKTIKGVPGRIETINTPKGYSVVVDYAHTPDGLENVLQAVKAYAEGEVMVVFGCGGDRDKTKRPLMGEVAARYADYLIITSDNPRSEDPFTILDEVEVGVKKHNKPYEKIEDRQQAIFRGMAQAKKGDVIVIAGKGHENYQILKDRIIHFDDKEIVELYLQGEEA